MLGSRVLSPPIPQLFLQLALPGTACEFALTCQASVLAVLDRVVEFLLFQYLLLRLIAVGHIQHQHAEHKQKYWYVLLEPRAIHLEGRQQFAQVLRVNVVTVLIVRHRTRGLLLVRGLLLRPGLL